MEVKIDGINYVPEGNVDIQLGHRRYDSPERMLWDIYSWYTHQVWEAGKNGDEEGLKQCVKDCDTFEECIKQMYNMRIHSNEYRFIEDI